MPARYYRLLGAAAASLSLLLTACGGKKAETADVTAAQQASAEPEDGLDTEATIWTVLGLAKKDSELRQAQKTGSEVSPILWQAALDTLSFAKIDSQDPMTGLVVTAWYTPKGKPNERLRITAFVKSRALRSDSLAISIERQVRNAAGQWQDSTIAKQVVSDLENDILQRSRQIRTERQAPHS